MQEANVIIYQIAILTLLGLVGFVAGKTKYLPDNAGTVLSRVVIKLTAPLLIFTTLVNYSFERRVILDGVTIYICGILFILAAYFISHFVSGKLPLDEPARSIYKMQSMFGNVIFLAYPLLKSIYGDKGIVYAVFFNLANDSVLWTLGIYLVNKHNTTRWRDNIKHLINGNTIAFGLGVLSIAFNLQQYVKQNATVGMVYKILYDAFQPLGHTTIYLSMIFIGLILAGVEIKSFSDLMKRYPLFILSFFKLLVVPAIAYIVLTLLGGIIDPFVKAIIVLQLAMPGGTIVAALASEYNADCKFATECVFVTTILGIFTLPFVARMLEVLGK